MRKREKRFAEAGTLRVHSEAEGCGELTDLRATVCDVFCLKSYTMNLSFFWISVDFRIEAMLP